MTENLQTVNKCGHLGCTAAGTVVTTVSVGRGRGFRDLFHCEEHLTDAAMVAKALGVAILPAQRSAP